MSGRTRSEDRQADGAVATLGEDLLTALVERPAVLSADGGARTPRVGSLVAIVDSGRTPLVTYHGQPGTQALRARTTVELRGEHIGQQVVLMFDAADPERPLIIGVVRGDADWTSASPAPRVEVEADGERLIVSAARQVVIRCGDASITLTKSGKVLIKGTYVSTHSTGVNRIKGGSVQIN